MIKIYVNHHPPAKVEKREIETWLTSANFAADCKESSDVVAAAVVLPREDVVVVVVVVVVVSSFSLFCNTSISAACFAMTPRREATKMLSSPLCAVFDEKK